MIIIEKPYVSETLVDSIVQNDWYVLENDALELANIEEGAFNILDQENAKYRYSTMSYPQIYSNSESGIRWVQANMPDSKLTKYLNLFKDKSEFRRTFADLYPNFSFKEVTFEDMKKMSLESLEFPLVIKPVAGFMGFGVHIVQNDADWKNALYNLEEEIKQAQRMFDESVISSSRFLIEDFVQGEEFAIDAYFDKQGQPVILNIFQHPYLNSKDVRNRIYMTSVGIMVKYLAKFAVILKQMGERIDARNLAIHMELRVTPDENIIPIEVNPMRFSGWCTTDVAKYAWGINVYEYFMAQLKPNWNEILEKAPRGVYYFSMAEVPEGLDKSKIKSFNYDKFLANYSNILEVRRINPKNNPLFAIIFGHTQDKEEVKQILQLNMKDYIIFS